MNKIKINLLVFLSIWLMLSGCSGTSSDKAADKGESLSEESKMSLDTEQSEMEEAGDVEIEQAETGNLHNGEQPDTSDRKVIYQAEVELEVKDFYKAQKELETKAKDLGGYIVESSASEYDRQLSGTMTFRIPEDRFQSFIDAAESGATKMVDRHVTGRDVTEEYVDVESRLRSKKAVETRLMAFMEEAEKTEDLLKISGELDAVQEEIEQLTGRLKYLQNQTAYATVTIYLTEGVKVFEQDDLNTWEKVEKQFARNINFLMSFLSGMIVSLLGNLPALIFLGLLAAVLLMVYRKIRAKKRSTERKDHE